jgi:hypothetical protein
VAGLMKDYSKGECWRVRKLVVREMKRGKVEQVKRGVYRLTRA